MTEGRIITSVAGTYLVKTKDGEVLAKPRGLFRKQGIKPAVGDQVVLTLGATHDSEASIERIKERTNSLVRPFVSNIDYALLVFSMKDPSPDFLLLDTLIVNCLFHGIEPVILFNKTDLVSEEDVRQDRAIYEGTDFEIRTTSVWSEHGLEELFDYLPDGLYVLAGQSGVGKSSLLNALLGKELRTGEISRKLGRGKHTTRQNSLLEARENLFFVDTPGFQTLALEPEVKFSDLKTGFPEFSSYHCKFPNCTHIHEPGCGVTAHLDEIPASRYRNYLYLFDQLSQRRNY